MPFWAYMLHCRGDCRGDRIANSRLARREDGPSTGSGRSGIVVPQAIIDTILAEAQAAFPCECCGILLGEGARIHAILPAANVHPRPETRFEIDPQALVDAHRAARRGGPQVLGYYHSHPAGPAEPSATDRAQAAHDGAIWAIAGEQEVRLWRDGQGGFAPLSYSLASD